MGGHESNLIGLEDRSGLIPLTTLISTAPALSYLLYKPLESFHENRYYRIITNYPGIIFC